MGNHVKLFNDINRFTFILFCGIKKELSYESGREGVWGLTQRVWEIEGKHWKDLLRPFFILRTSGIARDNLCRR
jgi:hypothetical protein